jgi:membrane protease YdiL (CAAX protease family)
MQSAGTVNIRFWQRIPVVIRAIVVGLFVFEIGVVAWVLIVGPLVPAPWSILVMGGVLWLYWKYFSGSWWPKSTMEARRNSFRDVKLSASVWKWGLLAAMFFVVVVQSGLVITFRIIEFPAEAFTAEYPFDALPVGLAWLFIVMSALVAGICEETGFRGYMQVPLENRYGPAVAITIVSLLFLITHLHQAWAVPILFHVAAISVLLGILAYAAGSLIPSMIGHTVMDIFNFSYWWSDVAGRFERQPIGETGLDAHFIIWLLVFTVSVVLFFWITRQLMAVRRQTQVKRVSDFKVSGP